ncbi:hypothetical protein BC828DRAFT_348864, partial [Blastocladiella britannica]
MELAELTQLRRLSVAHNRLASVPRVLLAFEHLTALSLAHNAITSALPAWLSYSTRLEELRLEGNGFDGAVPRSWSALSSMRVLSLGSATFGGNAIAAIPDGVLSGMPKLETLDVAGNRLERLPDDAFGSSAYLRSVAVDGNKLDTLPETIAQAPRLSAVRAAHNLLCRLPRALAFCPALEVLDLSGNALCFVDMDLILAVAHSRVAVLLTGNPF